MSCELTNAGHLLHKCDDESCKICPGGLAYCEKCKRGESEFWDDAGAVITCERVLTQRL